MTNRPIDSSGPEALVGRAYNVKSDAETKDLYRDWADTYDSAMQDGLGYLTPTKTAKLLSQYVSNSFAEILDVGAGTGLAGVALSELGFTIMDALDYSDEMLAVAAEKKLYRTLYAANLNNPLQIPDDTYQALICTGTFTHAHVGAGCLDELFRVLKPQGVFACTIHKDVWQQRGFSEKITKMSTDGEIETLYHSAGRYYANSESNEGFYIAWRRL